LAERRKRRTHSTQRINPLHALIFLVIQPLKIARSITPFVCLGKTIASGKGGVLSSFEQKNKAGLKMTTERWRQIKTVLHKAQELAPEERKALLDQVCSTHPSLRQELESLLSSGDRARRAF